MSARKQLTKPSQFAGFGAVLLAAIICVFQQFGFLCPIDDLLYDASPIWHINVGKASTDVVLVYATHETLRHPEALVRIIDLLRDNGAANVGVAAEIGKHSQAVTAEDGVVYGVLAAGGSRKETSVGTIDLLGGQSVYRTHYYGLTRGSRSISSLESLLASQAQVVHRSAHEKTFRICFRGGPNSLPNFQEQDVLAGDLVAEIVAGKQVLIGPRSSSAEATISVPGSQGMGMSTLELHGHILHTLLTNSAISEVHNLGAMILFSVATLLGYLLYHRLPVLVMLPTCVLVVVSFIASSWLSLYFWRYWIPATAIVLGQVGCCAVMFEQRLKFMHRALSHWSLKQRMRLPKGDDDAFWDSAAELTAQMFAPHRAVFLELPRGATHSKIAMCLGCDETHIYERRRDVRRAPYCSAIELGGPFETVQRQFFERDATTTTHRQFVAPLIFASETLGFLVLEFEADVTECCPDLIHHLRNFADQLSGNLAERRVVEEEAEVSIARRLTWLHEQEGIMQMAYFDELLQRRLTQLEAQFERANSGLAIFDVFGRLKMMNSVMHSQLQRRGVNEPSLGVAELVTQLSGQDHQLSRAILREVAIGKKSREVFVPSCDDHPSCVLFLSPLSAVSSGEVEEGESRRDSVLIELMPTHSGHVATQSDSVDSHLLQVSSVLDTLARPLESLQRQTIQGKRLTIERHTDANVPSVFAEPRELESVFEAILEMLEETARVESSLVVVVESQVVQVAVTFANQEGFSATDQLRHSMESEESPHERLRKRIERRIEQWSARLTITSNPQEGTIVQLVFRSHDNQPLQAEVEALPDTSVTMQGEEDPVASVQPSAMQGEGS